MFLLLREMCDGPSIVVMTSLAFIVLITVPAAVAQTIALSRSGELAAELGACANLTSAGEVHQLGSQSEPSQEGLVAQALLEDAARTEFATKTLPSVLILRFKTLCVSYAPGRYNQSDRKYTSTGVLVFFTCAGVACLQQSESIFTRTYQSLFSFVCTANNTYATYGHLERVGVITQVDRDTRSNFQNTIPDFENCRLCSVANITIEQDYSIPTTCHCKY